MMVIVCFFFSSRRRHTRFDCDWSSDVCSSDLLFLLLVDEAERKGCLFPVPLRCIFESTGRQGERPGTPFVHRGRSEEHTSELQSQSNLVCRLLLEKKKLGISGDARTKAVFEFL